MAKMIPSRIPDLLLNDRKRGAERCVYEALEQELSSEFVVYWSRPWHRIRPDGTGQDGEVDFVVAHPDLGVLAIEVKGGVVSCDDQGRWQSVARTGTCYNLKRSPVMQAHDGKYELRRRLAEFRQLAHRRLNLCHGVILPDNTRPSRDLGADAPLELFAFGNEIASRKIGAWIRGRLESGAAACDPLGLDGMRILHEIVAANFELRPHLARALAEDMKQIELLTADQGFLLEALSGNRQMAIAGAAGTGKTLLALEKAMRCAEAGERTLLTCFNKPLATHLQQLAGQMENLTIASFHEFCGKMAKAANIAVPSVNGPELFREILPSALERAMDARKELCFDAIIVDEGQDFLRGWYDALRLSLKDMEQGCFHVFYDDNQKIYGNGQSFVEELPKATCRLNRNLRNTKAIHQALAPWYDNRGVISAGPRGEPVDWTTVKTAEQAYTSCSSFVSELIKSGQLAPRDIAILTGGALEKCALFSQAQIGGARPVSASDTRSANTIICDTVRRFKGLESKCVILVDIDQIKDDELIYVALSRPSLLLKVIGLPRDIERLKGVAGH